MCPICCSDRKIAVDINVQNDIKNKLLLQKILSVTRTTNPTPISNNGYEPWKTSDSGARNTLSANYENLGNSNPGI